MENPSFIYSLCKGRERSSTFGLNEVSISLLVSLRLTLGAAAFLRLAFYKLDSPKHSSYIRNAHISIHSALLPGVFLVPRSNYNEA